MSLSDIINMVAVLLSLVSCFLVWKIWRLTKANSILILLLAIVWGTIIRLLIGISVLTQDWSFEASSSAVVGFWVFFPIGMYGLLHTLRKYMGKK